MVEKSKIAVLTGERSIDLKVVDIPEITEDEILVKVEGCGICGTDVHEYKGDPFGYIPIHLGHEGTGEIIKIGKNVTKDYAGKELKVGDKIVTGLKPCGTCDTCVNDPKNIHLCSNGAIYGLLPGEEHFLNGWFGEYIKINPNSVVFNVSDMSVNQRLLVEPAAVVVHAVEKAKEIYNFKHNSIVLIQGCGPIGLLLLSLLRTMGIRKIIAVDGDENRLNMAKNLGANDILNVSKTNQPIIDLLELTGGKGADFGFQCTGSPKAASMLWKYIKRGGGICELGFFVDNGEASYNPHQDICFKEQKVVGSWTYQSEDWIHACEFLKEADKQGWPLQDIITHTYSLEEINEAMEKNISMEGIKIVVKN